MYWGLKHGPLNVCCEFEKDPLKTKGCQAHKRKTKLTDQWQKMEQQSAENGLASGPWSKESMV